MAPKDDVPDDDVLQLLARHERSLQSLYEAFSRHVEGGKGFFWVLAQEEAVHARRLEGIRPRLDDAALALIAGKVDTKTVLNSIAYVEGMKGEAELGSMSMKQSLATALDLERSLVENKLFATAENDATDLRDVLHVIVRESRLHLEKVERAWLETQE
ncbi:MAG: hypothetical protein JW909_10395 [Planctomycetes bacterium]|nr:hypothetical protein [Planctomycetota bacterium]